MSPGGTTSTIRAALAAKNASTDQRAIGFPATTRHCLAVAPPALEPDPAATTIAEKLMRPVSSLSGALSRLDKWCALHKNGALGMIKKCAVCSSGPGA